MRSAKPNIKRSINAVDIKNGPWDCKLRCADLTSKEEVVAMSATGYGHGHKIIWDEGQQKWLYQDNGLPTNETWRDRPCGHCSKPPTNEGHDGCLGTLPNVRNACCGHGVDGDAYIEYWDRRIIRGRKAKDEQRRIIALKPDISAH